MVAMDFLAASNSYDFFNQYCSNLLKNSIMHPSNLHERSLRHFPLNLGLAIYSWPVRRMSKRGVNFSWVVKFILTELRLYFNKKVSLK